MTATPSRGLRILIPGREGQVGWELTRCMASLGEVTATSRAELDLASDSSIRNAVRDARPNLIVNAAAYTAVDKAESEPELAQRINADAVETLAAEAKAVGAAMIHYSTDYVFDGAKATAYVEEDTPNPLSVYGETKLAGEQALASAGIPYLVLRTSWVYGARGKNFLRTILKLATEKPELRIVDDQRGAPTWSRDIAAATRDIAKRWLTGSGAEGLIARSGTYHLTAAGDTTWCGFAAEALLMYEDRSGTRGQRKAGPSTPFAAANFGRDDKSIVDMEPTKNSNFARLVPIPSSEYPTPAARPKNSRLDCSKLAQSFQCKLPDWKMSLAAVIREIEGDEAPSGEAIQSKVSI